MSETHFKDGKMLTGFAKHAILKNYVNAWVPIMLHSRGIGVIVDGFAGTGKHDNGDDGSPLVILRALKSHIVEVKRFENPKIILIFIEQDPDHFKQLKANIEQVIGGQSTNNVQIEVYTKTGDFNQVMVDWVLKNYSQYAMLMVFQDPFGYSACKMSTCHKILATHSESAPKELIINLMDGNIPRFERDLVKIKAADELLGCTDWRPRFEAAGDVDAKLLTLYEIYTENLQKGYENSAACRQNKLMSLKFGIRRAQSNTHVYHIVFATTHPLGLEKMKLVMAKESQDVDDFIFSEWVLNKFVVRDKEFEKTFKVQDVLGMIHTRFGSRDTVRGIDIWTFILLNTPYTPNLKKELKKKLKNYIFHKDCNQFDKIIYSFTKTLSPKPAPTSSPSTPVKDFLYKNAIRQIRHHFGGTGMIVTGQQIYDFCIGKLSMAKVNFKDKLKTYLATYRVKQEGEKTREFLKMKYQFPDPSSSPMGPCDSPGSEPKNEADTPIKPDTNIETGGVEKAVKQLKF